MKKNPEPRVKVTSEGLDRVIRLIPSLESGQDVVFLLRRAFYDNGFVQHFDARAFFNNAAQRYIEDQSLVATADLTTCVKLITAHCRCDHFCEGHLEEMVQSGHILAIVRRLAELRKDLPKELKRFRQWQEELGKAEEQSKVALTVRRQEIEVETDDHDSLASRGQLIAPPRRFRVVGVDTFEAPDADYLVGDVPDFELAKQMANSRSGAMNPVYVYDDRGNLVDEGGKHDLGGEVLNAEDEPRTRAKDHSEHYREIVQLVLASKLDQARANLPNLSPLPPISRSGSRTISCSKQLEIFARDAFTCRYCGKRTIFVPVLRLLSSLFPTEFPFHLNWKMADCHIGYWRDGASCDHLIPVARGGSSDPNNLVTACYMCNSIKQNWLVEELRWELLTPNDPSWNGLVLEYLPLLKVVNDGSEYHRSWTKAVRSLI